MQVSRHDKNTGRAIGLRPFDAFRFDAQFPAGAPAVAPVEDAAVIEHDRLALAVLADVLDERAVFRRASDNYRPPAAWR